MRKGLREKDNEQKKIVLICRAWSNCPSFKSSSKRIRSYFLPRQIISMWGRNDKESKELIAFPAFLSEFFGHSWKQFLLCFSIFQLSFFRKAKKSVCGELDDKNKMFWCLPLTERWKGVFNVSLKSKFSKAFCCPIFFFIWWTHWKTFSR